MHSLFPIRKVSFEAARSIATMISRKRRYAFSRLSPWLQFFIAALIVLAVGCATNPVTGKRELRLISEAAEIQMGNKSYLPAQQSQGGQYPLDSALTAYVNGIGQRLAKVSDRPQLPYEFVVLNNSVPNAWAMPGGKIAVNRGLLLALENEAELAAVLAHEIVHAAARHSAKGVERGLLLQAGLIGVGVAASDSDYANLLVGAAAVGANLINKRYGRDAESESDYYGMLYMSRAGYDPKAAVSLQETFVRLSDEREPNWLAGLFASHPPSQERVNANRATLAQLPSGGRLGAAAFQAKIAELKKNKDAYERYGQGRKALQKDDVNQAMSLADEAIRIEPREALFYGLRGDALLKKGKHSAALAQYQQALKRNDGYYRFYLQRGLAEQKLDRHAAARADLERSNELMPTAIAHYSLGELALGEEQPAAALEHFRIAASSESTLGKKAQVRLARLDLPQNPGKYIAVQSALGKDGTIIVGISNRAPVAVKNVAVQISLVRNRRQLVDEETVFVRSILRPKERYRLRTHLRVPDGEKGNVQVHTEVISATVVN